MHNHQLTIRRVGWRMGTALLLTALLAGATACVPRETDAGRLAALPVNQPLFKEYKGANLYLLRRADDSVVVFWGISPLGAGARGAVTCFIQDRADRAFRGEVRPFVDPCRGAWWSHDGEFLGYTSDPSDAPSRGPPLVRIPVEVRDGRVILDEAMLRCLQSRKPTCSAV